MRAGYYIGLLLLLLGSIAPIGVDFGTGLINVSPLSIISTPVDASYISDIDIIGIKIAVPARLTAGKKTEIIDYLRNQGTDSSGSFNVEYYLDQSPDDESERILIGSVSVTPMNPGVQKTLFVETYIPDHLSPGSYYLIRMIDPDHSISGEDPSNNIQCTQEPVEILAGTQGSGVRGLITSMSGDLIAGSEISFSTTIENTLNTSSERITLSYYLSSDEILGSDDYLIGRRDVNPISSGEEEEFNSEFLIPADVPEGDYYLYTSIVSDEGGISGINEGELWYNEEIIRISSGNNSEQTLMSYTPVLPEPDIVSLGTSLPSTAYIGETFEVTDSVKNIGGSTASIVRVEYSLSPDETGKNGRHLGWWTMMNLGPDESKTTTELLGISSNIRPGFYYLNKKITVTSSPAEKNTANNNWISNSPIGIRYSPSAIIPDLTHVNTDFPCGQPGNVVQITDTITNTGNACANGYAVGYYISPYDQFDPATAWYLGVWNIDQICPGEQLTNTISVTIPGDLKNGTYYWYSVIDPCSFLTDCSDYMPELDKSNNLNFKTLYIGPCVFCGC